MSVSLVKKLVGHRSAVDRWESRDGTILLISGDYRDHGRERAAVGYDYDPPNRLAPWLVLDGSCAEAFDPSTWSPTGERHFTTDSEALAWSRANGYS